MPSVPQMKRRSVGENALSARIATCMRRRFTVLVVAVAAAGCDRYSETSLLAPPTASSTLREDVAPPLDSLARRLRASGINAYSELPDSLLWRFIAGGDSIAIVGIKEPEAATGVGRDGRSLVPPDVATVAFETLSGLPGIVELNRHTITPKLRVRVSSEQALRSLRNSPFTSYVHPDRIYDYRLLSNPGCGQPGYVAGYYHLPEGDVVPATYPWMFIDRAWGVTTGRGVKIGLTDTGSDQLQPELNEYFAEGPVPTRTVEWHGPQINPACSHGTRLAGVMAAPRNGRHIVGVAYGSNLYSYDHGDDLVPTWWEAENGIRVTGEAGSKVILIAWGTGLSAENVNDEINRWFGLGVTLVGAAGTWSECWWTNSNNVLWPAEKDEVIAVSPSQYDGTRPCSAAYGPSLDLVAYHGNPTTGTGAAGSNLIHIEGSSNAAAIVAGAAAMIIERFPGITPANVKWRLIGASDCVRPGMPGSWHRMLHAEAALGGICLKSAYPVFGADDVEFYPGDPDTKTVTLQVNTSTVTGINGGFGLVTFHFHHPSYPATYTTSFNVTRPPEGQTDYYNADLYINQSGSSAPPLRLPKTIAVRNNSGSCGEMACVLAPAAPPVRRLPAVPRPKAEW